MQDYGLVAAMYNLRLHKVKQRYRDDGPAFRMVTK